MKSFLDACRLVEPLQLVVEAAGEPDVGVRVLHQPFALVGRDPRADVPLEHRLVSRRHVYIQVVEGHAFWIDLESRLGTLGGGRPRKYGWLTREETIRIGPYELKRPPAGPAARASGEERVPEAVPLVSRSYGASPWPEVGLEFLNGPSRSSVWPMNRVVSLVGSAVGCKFRLADPSVSPFHCSLVRTQSGLWVVDLLGGGVEVNNTPVRYALLAEGDVVAVGRYRVRIRNRPWPAGTPDDAYESLAPAESRSLAITRPHPTAAGGLVATRPGDAGRPQPIQPVAVLPAEIERGGLGDSVSVLVPLMNQFGLMQQQMLDQFQSAMGMLVEMFGSLQREQMELIRQELDQLREVTREFQDLKAELASFNRERAGAAATSSPAPIPMPTLVLPPSASPEPGPAVLPASPAIVTPPSISTPPPKLAAGGGPTPPGVMPTPAIPPAAVADVSVNPSPSINVAAAVAAAQEGLEAAAVARPREDGPSRGPTRNRPERPARPQGNEADVMLWLNQRINSLQEERESRWQKILKLLPGSS